MLNYVGEDACFTRLSPYVLESVDFIVISVSPITGKVYILLSYNL